VVSVWGVGWDSMPVLPHSGDTSEREFSGGRALSHIGEGGQSLGIGKICEGGVYKSAFLEGGETGTPFPERGGLNLRISGPCRRKIGRRGCIGGLCPGEGKGRTP